MSLAYYRALMNRQEEIGLLLDDYTTTIPCFWLDKKISKSFTGDIVLIEEMTGNTTQSFTFNPDGSFPSSDVESFAGVGDARVRRLYEAKGDGTYIDFGTGTQSPLIVESGSIITDDNGRVSMRFEGSQYGIKTSSTADYNLFTNGTLGTSLTSIKPEVAVGLAYIAANFFSTGQRGFRLTHRTNYLRMQADYGSGYIYDSGGTAPSSLGQTDILFMKFDSDHATANERIYLNIDGAEYNNNTSTLPSGPNDASNSFTLGARNTGASGFKGLITGWIVWDSDVYNDRTEILSYL